MKLRPLNDGFVAEAREIDISRPLSPAEVAARLGEMGYETVWKDWESLLNGA